MKDQFGIPSMKLLVEQYKILYDRKGRTERFKSKEELLKYKQSKQPYGHTSHKYIETFQSIINKVKPNSILDYGCGVSPLLDMIENVETKAWYDPALKKYNKLPEGKFDLVLCTDVLEHIPEDLLEEFWTSIQSKSDKAIFVISTRTAKSRLPNGRNCHETVKPTKWWMKRIKWMFGYSELIEDKRFCNSGLDKQHAICIKNFK